MKLPFLKIFQSEPRKVPEILEKKLFENFRKAVNIEWEKKEQHFEAVFYVNRIEYIALFSETGELLEYKKNMWPDELSVDITNYCFRIGEIMNAISTFKNNEVNFEVIVRDTNFNRMLLVFDSNAKLLSQKNL